MTSAQRFKLAVTFGTGSLLTLIWVYFVASVNSFENPNAPWWQAHRWLWGILALAIPGTLVGVIANHKRWLGGVAVGVLGCLIGTIGIWVALAAKDSAYVESWLDVILLIAIICGTCAGFAWLTGVAHDRWSPNTSLERTRDR